MLVVYPIIYRVLYIQGGCLGFQPSTVSFYEMGERKNISSSNIAVDRVPVFWEGIWYQI